MVQWVTVLDAEVSATAFTGQFHHFPLPAARAFTLIGVDLTFLLCWIRATVSVNVLPHSAVRGFPSGHRHRHITEWAYRYLDILLVSRSTVMLSVGHMVCAEDARAGVTLERQKICREWVGMQVQRDLDVVPGHSSLPLKGRKTPPYLQQTTRP